MGRFSRVLSREDFPALADRYDIRAERITVGQLLERLTEASRIPLRTVNLAVREEFLFASLANRELADILDLIAEAFRWSNGRFGWEWKVNGEKSKGYLLAPDSVTISAEAQAARVELAAVQTALARVGAGANAPAAPGLRDSDLIAAVPTEVILAAIQEGIHYVPHSRLTPQLRVLGDRWLRSNSRITPAGFWLEVRYQRSGSRARLTAQFRQPGGGAGGALNIELPPPGEAATDREPSPASSPWRRRLQVSGPESSAWTNARTLNEMLVLLSRRLPADVIADDFGYRLRPGSSPPAGLAGEAILDRILGGVRVGIDPASVGWREVRGAALIRNRGWMRDAARRPDPKIRAELIRLARTGRPHILSLLECERLLKLLDPEKVQALEDFGLLRPRSNLAGLRPFLRFRSQLSPTQLSLLSSPAGLPLSSLPVPVLATVTREGPGESPLIRESLLRGKWQGDATLRVVQDPASGQLTQHWMPRQGKPISFSHLLALPELPPEVLEIRKVST